MPRRAPPVLLVLALLLAALPARAQTSRLPPAIEAMTAPLSEAELGGIGCLLGVAAGGAAVLALIGPGAAMAALQGPLLAGEVLHGGAALAFLLSSACYIGVAAAPVAAYGWATLGDELLSPAPAPPTGTGIPLASGAAPR